jgi:hypothetical protein
MEEWSGLGSRDIDGQAERPREREGTSQSLTVVSLFPASLAENKRCFPPSFNYGAAGDFARHDKKMKLGKLQFFAVSFAFRRFLSA